MPTLRQVLKWSKNLPGARLTFQREWMLGRRLNAAARQDPDLDLLLQTGVWLWPSTAGSDLMIPLFNMPFQRSQQADSTVESGITPGSPLGCSAVMTCALSGLRPQSLTVITELE